MQVTTASKVEKNYSIFTAKDICIFFPLLHCAAVVVVVQQMCDSTRSTFRSVLLTDGRRACEKTRNNSNYAELRELKMYRRRWIFLEQWHFVLLFSILPLFTASSCSQAAHKTRCVFVFVVSTKIDFFCNFLSSPLRAVPFQRRVKFYSCFDRIMWFIIPSIRWWNIFSHKQKIIQKQKLCYDCDDVYRDLL